MSRRSDLSWERWTEWGVRQVHTAEHGEELRASEEEQEYSC